MQKIDLEAVKTVDQYDDDKDYPDDFHMEPEWQFYPAFADRDLKQEQYKRQKSEPNIERFAEQDWVGQNDHIFILC